MLYGTDSLQVGITTELHDTRRGFGTMCEEKIVKMDVDRPDGRRGVRCGYMMV